MLGRVTIVDGRKMKTIVGAAALAASILITSSAAPGDDGAPAKDNKRPSWAKVVVNQSPPKAGAYYKGISRTAFSNSKWPQTR